jgi:nucleoside-diphosphate-sugar epimerase
MNSKIGVTGSTGVLGQAIQLRFKNFIFSPFLGDIRSILDIENWINSEGPFAAIIHLAAMVPTGMVEQNIRDAFLINVEGTLNLLEACRKNTSHKPWIFIASSSHVYDSASEKKLSESVTLRPSSIYGLTKQQAEAWAEIYLQKFSQKICVGRIFSFSSPKQDGSYFIPAMKDKIRSAAKHGELEVKGLGSSRDFLTTAQITEAIDFLFQKGATGTYNIGTGEGTSLLKIAEALKVRMDREDLKFRAPDGATNHLISDPKKLEDLGLTLKFDIKKFIDSV